MRLSVNRYLIVLLIYYEKNEHKWAETTIDPNNYIRHNLTAMQNNYEEVLKKAYTEFNKRNIEDVLLLMHPKVHWPNGWEGGYVNGHSEVRLYWTRQWQELNPNVQPVKFVQKESDIVDVTVHQIIKDNDGKLLFDGFVNHVYTFELGLIKSMDIVNA